MKTFKITMVAFLSADNEKDAEEAADRMVIDEYHKPSNCMLLDHKILFKEALDKNADWYEEYLKA